MQILPAIAIVVGCVLVALLGMLLVRRSVRLASLEAHKEIAGFVYATIGATYAVLLAFITIAVWEQYVEARQTAEHEVNELTSVFNLSQRLPEAERARVRQGLVGYARAVAEDEWETMRAGRASPRAQEALDGLWQAYARPELNPATEQDKAFFEESLDRLAEMSELRGARLVASRENLPGPIFAVLILGALITVTFSYFFGVESLGAQALMTAALALLVASILILVSILDNPFNGDVRIAPESFHLAAESFERQLHR
jgi:hypothetical protein